MVDIKVDWTRFKSREAFLEVLSKNDSKFKLIHSAIWSICWIIIAIQGIRYFYDRNLLNEDLNFWLWGFQGTLTCIAISIPTNIINLSIFYACAKKWFYQHRNEWNVFVSIQTPLLILFQAAVNHTTYAFYDIGLCAKFFMNLEHIRMILKMVSIIVNLWGAKLKQPGAKNLSDAKIVARESPKVAPSKNEKLESLSDQEVTFPTHAQFAYFLIAPTLIFRNHYPRNDMIRTTNIVYYTMLWLVGLSNWFFLFKYHFTFQYESFGFGTINATWIVQTLLWGIIIAPWFTFLFQTMYFHSYCNLAAEVTMFADRYFHLDWWNATMIGPIARGWNTLTTNFIKDCLYNPIYVYSRNRSLALYGSFFLSAIFHDYFLCSTFGFSILWWYWIPSFMAPPILMTYLDPLLYKWKTKGIKLPLRLGYFVLPANMYFMLLTYSIEYYSIKNCVSNENGRSWLNILGMKPNFFNCL